MKGAHVFEAPIAKEAKEREREIQLMPTSIEFKAYLRLSNVNVFIEWELIDKAACGIEKSHFQKHARFSFTQLPGHLAAQKWSEWSMNGTMAMCTSERDTHTIQWDRQRCEEEQRGGERERRVKEANGSRFSPSPPVHIHTRQFTLHPNNLLKKRTQNEFTFHWVPLLLAVYRNGTNTTISFSRSHRSPSTSQTSTLSYTSFECTTTCVISDEGVHSSVAWLRAHTHTRNVLMCSTP